MAKEISFKEMFKVLKKRLWVIVVATALGTLAGYVYGTFYKPVPLYQSATRVVIGANSNDMNTLIVMITDPTVLDKVSTALNGKRSPNQLSSEITTQTVDSSQVVSISVKDSNPVLAAKIANTTASMFKNEAANVLSFRNVQLLSPAKASPAPVNPSNHHKKIYGFIIGLAVGIGLAFLLNAVDDTVQSEKDLEILLESPVLGDVAKMNRKNMYRGRKDRHTRNEAGESLKVLNIGIKKGNKLFEKPEGTHQNQELPHKSTHSV